MATWVGKRMEVHCTGLGKALIAYLSGSQLESSCANTDCPATTRIRFHLRRSCVKSSRASSRTAFRWMTKRMNSGCAVLGPRCSMPAAGDGCSEPLRHVDAVQ